ncbi:uncharacterized protein LOC113214520, partial [Frankliniella occidentalis]|uniref:Uncharacterized protein LOC113214520 n=1 Tax=Frankliniella occidentalis TaxID=133901 RepID=A0A9C6XVN2_FRAOC
MVVMALLNCLQRPEDPGGFAQAHGDAATTAVLFWENKCRMVLKELDAAHVVSQVMVRDYTTAHAQAQHALREKERESEEWQQKLARAQSKIESLEAERERWLEDKAHGRKQLHESEQQWKSEKGNLQREVSFVDQSLVRRGSTRGPDDAPHP